MQPQNDSHPPKEVLKPTANPSVPARKLKSGPKTA